MYSKSEIKKDKTKSVVVAPNAVNPIKTVAAKDNSSKPKKKKEKTDKPTKVVSKPKITPLAKATNTPTASAKIPMVVKKTPKPQPIGKEKVSTKEKKPAATTAPSTSITAKKPLASVPKTAVSAKDDLKKFRNAHNGCGDDDMEDQEYWYENFGCDDDGRHGGDDDEESV